MRHPREPESTLPGRDFQILEQLLVGTADEQRAEVEGVLFDPVTHLPTVHLLLKQIHATLQERGQVGILTLHVSPYVKIEELFGWDTFDELLRAVAEFLQEVKHDSLREGDFVGELSMSGGSFVFVLSPPRYNPFVQYDDLDRMRNRIRQQLLDKLEERFPEELVRQFGCFVGCVVVNHEPNVPVGRLIMRALDAAYTDAFQEREREFQDRKAGLLQIIAGRQIRSVYQPIIDLAEQWILGYEAFSRAPEGPFANPSYLFTIASEMKVLWQLERLCREQAVARLPELEPDQLLFINVEPESIFDPELRRWSREAGLEGRVVLEVTERSGVEEYILFRRVLDVIRSVGLRVAVDDVGSAYSGLRMIAETQPDFIKLDMGLTRGMRDETVRRELVSTIADFSTRVGTPLIVEGVEEPADLEVLRTIGVRYVQGYLFARPAPHFAQVDLSQVASA